MADRKIVTPDSAGRSITALIAFILLAMPLPALAERGPNFVVILVDDQGWNALSTRMDPEAPGSGSTYYQTPRLARLASEGMRFSQAYSPSPTCAPSRYAIQFGRSPTSLKIFGADDITDFDAGNDEALANVLKRIDPSYVCAHLGKWHIARSPRAFGYDASDGRTKNARGNSRDPEDPKLIFSLSRRANAFMSAQVEAGRPFYLQISHYADHLKFQARDQTIRKYETEQVANATEYQDGSLWAAMNEDLDTGIGLVLDEIEALGIADETYVIYTADNGYESKLDWGKPIDERGYYQAHPQRSHKYHLSEGGIRVPFIVRGPGITPGTHSSTAVVGTDLFATVMELAGGRDQVPTRVEGASLVGHLKSAGAVPIERPDPFLVFKYSKPRFPHDAAIVQGRYKLLKEIDSGRRYLYDLKKDVGERHDLAASMAGRVQQMDESMTSYFQRFGWNESMIGAQGTD